MQTRVLVIDDSRADFLLVEHAIGSAFELRHAPTFGEALSIDATQVDLVILDLNLDDSQGYETFEKARAAMPRLPIIVLSGSSDDDLAMRAVANGAQDYVRKMQLPDYPLDRAARYAVERQSVQNLAEELARRQGGLRQAVTGLERILGILEHELRTPLAALRAISEFLAAPGSRDLPEAEGFLSEIAAEVNHMSDTVDKILEAARLTSGRATWNWSEFDIETVITDVIVDIRPSIDSSRVRLEYEGHTASSAPMPHVRGDKDAVRRLLRNLLTNSCKHTLDGWIVVKARRYSSDDATWIEILVSDSGTGVPDKLLPRLGEAFALNAGAVGEDHLSGTGLGLSICRAITSAHGGNLRIESKVSVGTTATARFRVDMAGPQDGQTYGALPVANFNTTRCEPIKKAG